MKNHKLWLVVVLIIIIGCGTTSVTKRFRDTITPYAVTETAVGVTSEDALNEEITASVSGRVSAAEKAIAPVSENLPETEVSSYVSRLEELDAKMERLGDSTSDTSNSLKSAAEQERRVWESEMQRIMEILARNLSEQEKEELIREQKLWMRDREDEALAASRKQHGSALEELEYIISHSETTRERTYELAEQYAVILAETD